MDRSMALLLNSLLIVTLFILMLPTVQKYLENGFEVHGAGMELFFHLSMMVLGISKINLLDILEQTTLSGMVVERTPVVLKWSIIAQVCYLLISFSVLAYNFFLSNIIALLFLCYLKILDQM